MKSPVQWPNSKGLSFCCWLRVENFPDNGMMGLFSFFTENGKGCLAMLGKNTLVYEVMVVASFISRTFAELCLIKEIIFDKRIWSVKLGMF